MRHRIATGLVGMLAAVSLLACQNTGPNPDNPPKPIPGPTAGRKATTPPIGRQVACPIIDACKPVPKPTPGYPCNWVACRPASGHPATRKVYL
jgi:hypothetical protein